MCTFPSAHCFQTFLTQMKENQIPPFSGQTQNKILMKNFAHKTLLYALHVLAEEIHTPSLQIKLAVTHAKFPLTEGKSGILRKNITFTFYKHTELNPDRNSQTKS